VAKSVFYSFHYDVDVWRVQEVQKIGAVESQLLLNSQDWEKVQRGGKAAVEKWIDEQMSYKKAVVVLVGAQTASRPWVRHEILNAWNASKPLLGIRIHGLKDQNGKTAAQGADPFAAIKISNGQTMSAYVPLHNPAGSTSQEVYSSIRANIEAWVDSGYKRP
jgi:MTH538 TIR-like domain (DUF1863)